MIELVDFKAEHMNFIVETGMQDTYLKPYILPGRAEELEKSGKMYTILEDSKPVVVGGFITYWSNRGEAWLLFGKPKTKNFVGIFKVFQRILEISPLNRIEMVVEQNFFQGHRMARLLGFKKEADRMVRYLPNGSDATLYALVRC